MASGFFALLDDIALLMDDVAAMSKIATKKTAGILGDDLAVNAQKASGFASSREIPLLLAITKGSLINKLIILPVVFILNFIAPWIIVPILLLGGIYLAYEGVEKIYEYLYPHKKEAPSQRLLLTPKQIINQEQAKVSSAIKTDFILSIEIVIIALSTVIDSSLIVQILVVSFISIIATIGVYGIVALIVRMDDFGYSLIDFKDGNSGILDAVGRFLVASLPKVIKLLTIVGTIALLLVSGGIYTHNIEPLSKIMDLLPSPLADMLVGAAIGVVALMLHSFYTKFLGKERSLPNS